jgi:fatty acid desaturase
MNPILACSLIAVFTGLTLIHLYWLFGGRVGQLAAIPELDGKLILEPSPLATFMVAIALGLCALLIAGTAGMLALPFSQAVLAWMTRGLAGVLFLRAMGDFRLVGFFKQIRDTRFARLDTTVYPPLCLVSAIGAATVGFAAHV